EDVEPTELGDDGLDRGGTRVGIVDRSLDGDRRAAGRADRLDSRLGGLGITSIVDADRGALRCQQLADGAADPSAAAGDESDSPIELTHVPLSFAKCSVCQPVYMHEGSRRAIIAA